MAVSRTLLAVVSGVLMGWVIPPAAGGSPVHCSKTYTIQMFRQAAHKAYAGTRTPSRRERAHLHRFMVCQRSPGGRVFSSGVLTRAKVANADRKMVVLRAGTPVIFVSFYNDAGSTASGWHATYGFATCGSGGGPCLGFGTRVEFCFPAHSANCIVGVADDHGPYVGGRGFDLNQNIAAALGFGGLGDVSWRIV